MGFVHFQELFYDAVQLLCGPLFLSLSLALPPSLTLTLPSFVALSL